MRYFLDTEYNGIGGALLSLALVPDDGEELYLTLRTDEPIVPWVERYVVPYLDTVDPHLVWGRMSRPEAAEALERYLRHDDRITIIVDWPEDIAKFCELMITGPGDMVEIRDVTFRLLPLSNFSTAVNSRVPHNALHDARALRDHYRSLE
ncbi:hypothetical protein H8M03_09730 [Sphingomonas sabuli]|uniref:Uncharacterized protein n=1 Tax=Sphingomonas sabuli TaxID=2764186 RepID=A0A7G9L0Z3_9SPHN|nr:hypothetical protein [Sphingomonas sabuli]QNM82292.1 hypothetical protein H8M03_09730 [Sphingomonas sabuli]